jgi:hypothetical protein
MSIISAILGAIIGIFFIAWAISALFMLVAAKVSAVEGASFGKALLAAFGCSFITWLCAAVFSVLPVIGTFLGMVVGILLSMVVIKSVFATSFGRAFLVWIFNALGQAVAVVVAVLTFAGALFSAGSHVVHSLNAPSSDQRDVGRAGGIEDARRVAAALEGYATDMNAYPTATSNADVAAKLVPYYIKEIPEGLQIESTANGYVIRSSTGAVLLSSPSP